MADTGTGLDTGHRSVIDAGIDELFATSGDQQVHQAGGRHQFMGAGVGRILNKTDQLSRQAGLLQSPAQRNDDGVAAFPGVGTAAQNTGAARLNGQSSGIGGYIGAALIDDRDEAHGNSPLFDTQPIGTVIDIKQLSHRVRQHGHCPYALCHRIQPGGGQQQPVQHGIGNAALGGVHILSVGRQYVSFVF